MMPKLHSIVEVWPTGYLAEALFAGELHGFVWRELLAHVLLVGVKSHRELFLYDAAIAAGGKVTIVEPFAKNAAWARPIYPHATVRDETVQDYIKAPGSASVTLAVWLQGPEHVPHAEALRLLDALRVDGRARVVAEMPHGIHEQGADGGNPLEEHRAYLYPHDFDPAVWNMAVGPTAVPRERSPHQNVHLLVWSRR